MKFPVPLYPGVPPIAVTEMLAFPPKQGIGEVMVAVGVNAVGCVMEIVVAFEQPFASVTV